MNAKKFLLSSLGLFLLVAPASQTVGAEQQPSTMMATDNDANTTQAIKDAFAKDSRLAKDAFLITVVTKNGAVILTGRVPDQKTKDLLKQKALEIRGVKSVDNNSIEVK